VNPAAGAVHEAAQRGLARGGVVAGAGVEGQAGTVEERDCVVEGLCGRRFRTKMRYLSIHDRAGTIHKYLTYIYIILYMEFK
jgi:hypothetical protein